MKIYSEILKKTYDTVEDCLAAEKKYTDQIAAEEKAKSEKAAARKARAKEVENALRDVAAARKKYNELLTAFCRDYGVFHMSYDGKNSDFDIFRLYDLF